MADTKITGLAELTTGNLVDGDLFVVVDVSDTTMDAAGTDKKVLSSSVKTYLSLGDYVAKALYDAHTVVYATSDNTPVALTVGEQTVVGRITGGNIVALTPAQLCSILSGADAGGMTLQDVGAVEYRTNTVATSGATETLDTSVYSVHKVTMDQACEFTFSNPAPSGETSAFLLFLAGAFTPTFPGSVDWGDATPPTYTTPSLYAFYTNDAGTTWLGVSLGKAFA
jgi:hypothetical protein